jgi:hypothetical protein
MKNEGMLMEHLFNTTHHWRARVMKDADAQGSFHSNQVIQSIRDSIRRGVVALKKGIPDSKLF